MMTRVAAALALSVAATVAGACSSTTAGSGNGQSDGGSSSGAGSGGSTSSGSGSSGASGSSSGSASSSGGSSGGSLSGTLGGHAAFTVQTVIGNSGPVDGGAGYEAIVGLLNLDIPNACAAAQTSEQFANTQAVLLVVVETTPIVAGQVYAVVNETDGGVGTGAEALYSASNATCQNVTTEEATGGTVTFTTLSSTTMAGTFTVTFSGGDSASGSFDIPVCAGLALGTESGDGGEPACTTL